MIGLLMNGELERIWKEVVVVLTKYNPDIFLEGLRKTTKHLGVLAEIRTEHLPNTSLERYF
jgi:hypothetical protein